MKNAAIGGLQRWVGVGFEWSDLEGVDSQLGLAVEEDVILRFRG